MVIRQKRASRFNTRHNNRDLASVYVNDKKNSAMSGENSKHDIAETQALEALLAGKQKNVLAILPTGFGKSLIYFALSMAQTSANEMNCHGIPLH